MGADKQMELMMQIKAKADQFKATMNEVDSKLQSMQNKFATLRNASGTAFNIIGRGLSLTLAPMRLALQAGTALAGGMLALGSASVYAAAEDEKLAVRLTALYGNADRANRVVDELGYASMRSGKSVDELADALVLLDQYGLASSANLGAVTNAARVANSSVADMAMSIATLQTRGLKRMGIEMEMKDDKYIISARDKSGKVREIIAKDADEARKKLLGIFSFKVGTNMHASGLLEMLAAMKNGFSKAFGEVGAGMLPAVDRMIAYLNEKMMAFVKGGSLKNLGEKIGEGLNQGTDSLIAMIRTLPQVWETMKKLKSEGGNAIREVLLSAFKAGAEIFTVSFTSLLAASGSIWLGIGQLLASAIMRPIMLLPGMGGYRQNKMEEALAGMNFEQYTAMRQKYKIDERGINTWKELRPEQQAEIASMTGGNLLKTGIGNIKDAIPGMVSNIAATVKQNMLNVNKTLTGVTGIDIGKTFEENRQRARLERYAAGREIVIGQMSRYEPVAGNPLQRELKTYTKAVEVEAGTSKLGQKYASGYTVVNIGKLEVRADNEARLTNEMMRAAGRAPLAAAGT